MRVTGGKFKSRKLIYPKTKATRPTSDMVKLAVFNMLDISSGVVLDLFAGSGSYGIEAISRGASFAYFIDYNQEAINVINENIKALEIKNETKVIKTTYEKFLKTNQTKFDYIFLDPPFDFKNYYNLINELYLYLNDNGVIILEVSKNFELGDLEKYNTYKEKIYGNKKIIILHK